MHCKRYVWCGTQSLPAGIAGWLDVCYIRALDLGLFRCSDILDSRHPRVSDHAASAAEVGSFTMHEAA